MLSLRTKAFLFIALLAELAWAKESPAKPEPTSVVAYIELGRSISQYPECDTPDGQAKICAYEVRSDQAKVSYRPQFPSWVHMAPVVTLKNSVISDVNLTTKGVDVQEEVLSLLTAQYGKPKSLKRTVVQNTFGATFPKIEAFWSLKWGSVIFVGVTDNIKEGLLSGSLSKIPSPPQVSEARDQNTEPANASLSLEAMPPNENSIPGSESTVKPKLGVDYFPTGSRFAQVATMDIPRGVVVGRVANNSVAANAGLKVGDMILAVNGVPVQASMAGLQEAISGVKRGDLVNMTVWRGGHKIAVPVQF